jgi:hypothetical protein
MNVSRIPSIVENDVLITDSIEKKLVFLMIILLHNLNYLGLILLFHPIYLPIKMPYFFLMSR